MSDDLSKVDWGEPIEAYHTDGRVLGAVLHPHEPQPDEDSDYEIVAPGVVPTACFREDGAPSPNGGGQGCGWRIRNVAEVPASSQPPSDDIAKRMEALVRAVADDTSFASWMDHTAEARAIVALLPEPVDADLVEARKIAQQSRIARDEYGFEGGRCDDHPLVVCALAAIKRGKEMGRQA